jgi:hypothetical protein
MPCSLRNRGANRSGLSCFPVLFSLLLTCLVFSKMDYCGRNDSIEGHKNFSKALNATGRPMILELCRGPYTSMDKWGYAPEIAQVWRATGDHHDNFDSTLDQLSKLKGRCAQIRYGCSAHRTSSIVCTAGAPGVAPMAGEIMSTTYLYIAVVSSSLTSCIC